MKIQKLTSLLLISFTSLVGSAQVNKDTTIAKVPDMNNQGNGNSETRILYQRKGNFFLYWGYNRAAFSKSDIRFWGDGYDFTIFDVTGTGVFHFDFLTYIKPNTFTVPQYNERVGYFLNDKNWVSFGHDHMKYALDRQIARLSGTIDSGLNAGTYNNTTVLVGDGAANGNYLPSSITDSLPQGFVPEFEHCDGLNDFSFEFGHLEQLWISKNSKHALSFQTTVGSGMVIPDTDADVLDYTARHNMETGKKSFHLAGYSLSASAGLQIDLFKHFFILGKLKAGYINLPDIRTTTVGGKASQHFTFIEPILLVGYTHHIGKR